MSADFWAGYISGAVGIIIGNPLDIIKVRLQAASSSSLAQRSTTPFPSPTPLATTATTTAALHVRAPLGTTSFITGTAAPVMGYGALNALLFVSYNRTLDVLTTTLSTAPPPPGSGYTITAATAAASLWAIWTAGAVGGLATWVVSTPTELIKCRAQLAVPYNHRSDLGSGPGPSSWRIAREVWRAQGLRGLYFGGTVTAFRDSIGYGFYFWSYELATRWMASWAASAAGGSSSNPLLSHEAARVLFCGGVAGIVTWASIFPLDVIKTRLQTQVLEPASAAAERSPLISTQRQGLSGASTERRKGTRPMGVRDIAREAYREGGVRVFFRGLTVCSVRAFIVNAVQWAVYEWVMLELGQGKREKSSIEVRDSP